MLLVTASRGVGSIPSVVVNGNPNPWIGSRTGAVANSHAVGGFVGSIVLLLTTTLFGFANAIYRRFIVASVTFVNETDKSRITFQTFGIDLFVFLGVGIPSHLALLTLLSICRAIATDDGCCSRRNGSRSGGLNSKSSFYTLPV
jgi:hypothetical protein